ncbi:hypothetical protein [Lysinibacter sp. HNR]|uniref:baeRF11 domain-containing protein n=1 Tax=Lysinibacter sp. HNR TaxID=3031408 RepID=UPI0024347FD5|nr:hypothetical protein [Lysinibacter sp. HNR]WGD36517.1 hypothetical protein FrondiHNR_08520 [Lysinibacter sp. HNR]
MLYIDIPTRADIEQLVNEREPVSVSIYLQTNPIPSETEISRIELKNLTASAVEQLRAVGAHKADIESVQEQLEGLIEDSSFWRYLSRSLALFVTPQSIQTFRLPNVLESTVEVADRFYVKPLLRAVTFPQAAFVLALAVNSVRLIEISADAPPVVVEIPGMPEDAADAVGLESINGRSPDRRIQGSEGHKVRLRQYARAINQALRPAFTGINLPLILAGTEPMLGIFRSVNTYPNLAEASIQGNPEETTDADLASEARKILDDLYAAELKELKDVMASRGAHGKAITDLSDVARAATFGAVETLFVDIDRNIPGIIDEESGAITLAPSDDARNYGVVDEILRRALLSQASIFAVREPDMPGGGAVAASVRFPV